jgi:hypothetical protein
MNRRLSKQEHARRLAVALIDTRRRYLAGFMTHRTYKVHIRSLVGAVQRHGLTREVARQLAA